MLAINFNQFKLVLLRVFFYFPLVVFALILLFSTAQDMAFAQQTNVKQDLPSNSVGESLAVPETVEAVDTSNKNDEAAPKDNAQTTSPQDIAQPDIPEAIEAASPAKKKGGAEPHEEVAAVTRPSSEYASQSDLEYLTTNLTEIAILVAELQNNLKKLQALSVNETRLQQIEAQLDRLNEKLKPKENDTNNFPEQSGGETSSEPLKKVVELPGIKKKANDISVFGGRIDDIERRLAALEKGGVSTTPPSSINPEIEIRTEDDSARFAIVEKNGIPYVMTDKEAKSEFMHDIPQARLCSEIGKWIIEKGILEQLQAHLFFVRLGEKLQVCKLIGNDKWSSYEAMFLATAHVIKVREGN